VSARGGGARPGVSGQYEVCYGKWDMGAHTGMGKEREKSFAWWH